MPRPIPIGPGGPREGVGPGPFGAGAAAGGGDAESVTNMELNIYGIMTLYQRYPPRPVTPSKQ